MRFLCGRSYSEPSLAPSAVPLAMGKNALARLVSRGLWGTPREMSERDIDEVVEQFVAGARLARETGWDGVELHASHGYLLAQFMSPKVGQCDHTLPSTAHVDLEQVNRRQDAYGGTARKRLTLLFRILDAIRAEMPQRAGFVVGVKLNSSDYVVSPVGVSSPRDAELISEWRLPAERRTDSEPGDRCLP